MTSILDRYIGRQVLIGTLSAVVILTLLFGLGNVFKHALPQLVDHSLSIERFGLFILHILPFAVAYTVPWGFLTAVLLTFGRLSADSELISMRMAGLSIWRISRPVIFLAILFSGLCFWLNFSISPRSKAQMKRIITDVVSEDPSIILRQPGLLGNQVITADRLSKDHFKNIRLFQFPEYAKGEQPSDSPLTIVFAKTATLSKLDDAIQLEMRDIQIELRDEAEPRNPFKAATGIQTENYPYTLALDRLKQKKAPKSGEMTSAEIREGLHNGTITKDKAIRYETELTKRYSISGACLAFCLIGIPLGVTAQRRETSIGFALSLGIAVSYFVFIFFGEALSDEASWIPHALIALPFVLFSVIGARLLYRLNKS